MNEHRDIGGVSPAEMGPDDYMYRPWTPPPASRFDVGRVRILVLPFTILLVLIGLVAIVILTSRGNDEGLDQEIAQLLEESSKRMRASATAMTTESGNVARFSVRSIPAGATVRLDFDSIGTTPLLDYEVQTGIYLLAVESSDGAFADTIATLDDAVDGQNFVFALGDSERDRLSEPEQDAFATAQASPILPEPTQPARTERPEQETRRDGSSSEPSAADARRPAAESGGIPPTPQREEPAGGSSHDAAPVGTLIVTSNPPGSAVYVDGSRIGVTPIQLRDVAIGDHRLTIMRPEYRTVESVIEVQPDELLTQHVELEVEMGGLTILVEPWGSIYIDGELRARDLDVQYRTQLPTGVHTVEVVHPALGSKQQQVRIRADAPQNIVFDLSPDR